MKNRLEKDGIREMRAQMLEDESEESSETLSMAEIERLNREVEGLKRKV